jgi:S1-C subfamily serine protease
MPRLQTKGAIMDQIILAFLLAFFPWATPAIKPHVKAPTTHYHGYELNRVAIKKAKAFTVLISAEGFGGIERGSGVLIDSMTVLTCAHVAAASNENLWVIPYPGNEIYHAKIKRFDESDDLALLTLDRPTPKVAYPVFQDMHYDGEPITIIGNIEGSMKWFVAYGIVSGENARDLYTDGLVRGGDSGGPWINEQGEIVAITDWGLEYNGKDIGISGGVSAKTVHSFMEEKSLGQILQLLIGG